MSTHNICFRWEIRKISAFFGWTKHLICCFDLLEAMFDIVHTVLWRNKKNIYISTAMTPQKNNLILPFNSGSFTNSLFLVTLKREEFWRLSFFTWGGPANFILLIAVAGGCVSVLGLVPFFFAYVKRKRKLLLLYLPVTLSIWTCLRIYTVWHSSSSLSNMNSY